MIFIFMRSQATDPRGRGCKYGGGKCLEVSWAHATGIPCPTCMLEQSLWLEPIWLRTFLQGITQGEPVHPQSNQGRTKGRLLLWLLLPLRLRL